MSGKEGKRMEPAFDYDAELQRYHQRLVTALDVRADDRVLDIGCGTGLTTRESARKAESAVGVDISEQMVETARRISEEDGLRNVDFEVADVQVHPFPAESFSLGVSRFGTMFFGDPEAAFANIARALRPGARLVQLVWQDVKYQGWHTAIRQALADGRDVPATGGAFSLADPATSERLLTTAGFKEIEVTDVREPVYYGPDAETACNAARSLQLTQNLLAGLNPAQTDEALQRLVDTFATHQTPDGIWLDTRAWLITAHRQ
jgi:ubiquinone/menaquinone biosynthesis C-methylase UbiE